MDQQSGIPGNRPSEEKAKRKKRVKRSIFIVIALLIVFTTAIFHIFGPYKGKVVDLETGEPIEGASVLMCFYTEAWCIVDSSSEYAGAVETVTDSNGEFRIRSQWVLVFHVLSWWNPHGYITIFKPEYGVYPDHDDSGPLFMPNGTIPEREYVTIKLPKLETIAERRDSVSDAWPNSEVPGKKAKNLLKLLDEEAINTGLK